MANKGEARLAEYIVPAGKLDWLVDLLMDAGGFKRVHTAEGLRFEPLGWSEIAAWVTGADQHGVHPIWRREIIRLSEHYAAQIEASFDLACPAPYEPD